MRNDRTCSDLGHKYQPVVKIHLILNIFLCWNQTK